jgi:hypothetical protein
MDYEIRRPSRLVVPAHWPDPAMIKASDYEVFVVGICIKTETISGRSGRAIMEFTDGLVALVGYA